MCAASDRAPDIPVTAPELFHLAEIAARPAGESPPDARRIAHSEALAGPAGVRSAMRDALRAVCVARGWDGRVFSLAQALPRAMGDPALVDAWLDGARLSDPAARVSAPEADLVIERLAGAL